MIKFIVYLTINVENQKSYIGVHKTNSMSFDGYIGCGIKGKGDNVLKHPRSVFQFAVKKYGYNKFHRITLQEFNTEEEAYKLESQLVTKQWVESEFNYNIALGGKAGNTTNRSRSVLKYSLKGSFIEEFNSVSDAVQKTPKTSRSEINKAAKSLNKTSGGFRWRYKLNDKIEETIEFEISKNTKRRIVQKTLNGNIVDYYPSVRAAQRAGFKGVSHVLKGINKTCNGFIFSYED